VRFEVRVALELTGASENNFGRHVDGVDILLDGDGTGGRRRIVRTGGALRMDWLMFSNISRSIRKVSPGSLPGLAGLEVL
jgi:hypothetical protein